MAQTPKRLFIAAVLAATGAFAVAQTPAPATPAAGETTAVQQRGRMDPAEPRSAWSSASNAWQSAAPSAWPI
ncbi:hypothetical protein H0I39_09865 [Ottowia beijingensis]|uniref:Uncharacterized protein n=1 Tax=Ottowia beijingensis TaxID=1207057 RepID=A0A853IV69_9BURK|nr:hypothetical protein [Ottowia beijingensis]NZA01984.1 hypothetical protein [Ottowia beijingensis]